MLREISKRMKSRADALREWIYFALAVCLSLVLTISVVIAIRPDFPSLANLGSISTVLLTVEGILLGLAVLQKSPFSRVVIGFLNLVALSFSLDTLMLVSVVSQIQGGNVRSQVNVLAPFTMSPLDLFFWNFVFFVAGALSFFALGIATDFYNIRLKKRKPPQE